MTPEEFLDAMRQIVIDEGDDFESSHGSADELMCKALRELGYHEGVEIFEKMEKWYA